MLDFLLFALPALQTKAQKGPTHKRWAGKASVATAALLVSVNACGVQQPEPDFDLLPA